MIFLFTKNLHMNFGEIGSHIKELMDEFQRKSKSQAKVESIADMKVWLQPAISCFGFGSLNI